MIPREQIALPSRSWTPAETHAYLTAEVANTWPLDPTDSTIIEATTTIRSAEMEKMRLQVRLWDKLADVQYKGGVATREWRYEVEEKCSIKELSLVSQIIL